MLISKNRVEIWGNIARAPEVRVTKGGIPVANITVVTVHSWRGADGVEHEESAFIPVECFGSTAEWAGQNLSPGVMVVVEGRLKPVSWGDEANKKFKMLVSADKILSIR